MIDYYYEMLYRPASYATCPKGWRLVEKGTAGCYPLRQDLPVGRTRYGVVAYAAALPDETLKAYEMRLVGAQSSVSAPEPTPFQCDLGNIKLALSDAVVYFGDAMKSLPEGVDDLELLKASVDVRQALATVERLIERSKA